VSIGNAINDAGQVVGRSSPSGNTIYHAFLHSDGTMTDLGTLGGTSSTANAINGVAQIVGASQIVGDSAYRAFLYQNGTMTNLGTLGGNSYATGINANGQIVGYSEVQGQVPRAFLYQGGVMRELLSLIDPQSGWTALRTAAINDKGQIVGVGDIGGHQHAYLLTVVPEPGTTVLASIAGVALMLYTLTKRRRAKYV
jgi:probable HAF family extracellular repeat protein